MHKVHFEADDDIINICWDNVFKSVFTRGTPESQGALSKLLTAITGRELTVSSITANEPPPESLRDRQIRFDINCITSGGELANVEMTFHPDTFEPLRIEFFAGKLYTSQDIRGNEKSYKDLKTSYQISFLLNKTFFNDEAFVHTFEYYDAENKTALGGRTRIFTVELEKLKSVLEKRVQDMSGRERWAVFLRYISEPAKRPIINEILEIEEGIRMAGEVVLTISKDLEEKLRLMSEYKGQLDHQSRMVEAKREGRREGQREIALNMFGMGLSPEQIAKATDLSVEAVLELRK
jgi:predicted transposase/invertase (TIGR01784 family)